MHTIVTTVYHASPPTLNPSSHKIITIITSKPMNSLWCRPNFWFPKTLNTKSSRFESSVQRTAPHGISLTLLLFSTQPFSINLIISHMMTNMTVPHISPSPQFQLMSTFHLSSMECARLLVEYPVTGTVALSSLALAIQVTIVSLSTLYFLISQYCDVPSRFP